LPAEIIIAILNPLAKQSDNILKTLDKSAASCQQQYYFAMGVSRNIITKPLQLVVFIT